MVPATMASITSLEGPVDKISVLGLHGIQLLDRNVLAPSGSLAVSGTQAMRGIGHMQLIVCAYRIMQVTEIEKREDTNSAARTSLFLLVFKRGGREMKPQDSGWAQGGGG